MDRIVRVLVTGIIGLTMVVWATRGRLRGRYWRWRRETALGTDESAWPDGSTQRRAMLAYGAWVWRMRRLSR